MVVPADAARDVTPPRMRVSGARGEMLRGAFEDAFVGAAPPERPVACMFAAEEEPQAPCPVFTEAFDPSPAHGGARRRIVLDERGEAIQWPWEGRQEEEPPDGVSPGNVGSRDIVAERFFAAAGPGTDRLGTHAADATVCAGLAAATADGRGGENSTGVRAYKAFCRRHQRAVLRPVDPNAPLWVKLSEETWAMRFIAEIIDDRTVAVDTARGYFGAANKWHLRKTGIGLAAGMDLKRLAEMVKGLKNLRDEPSKQLRRGLAPQSLRAGMDLVYPPTSAEN